MQEITDAKIDPWRQGMVDAVKRHAEAHYEDGGWDVIVECWSDEMIAEWLSARLEDKRGAVRSAKGAIRRMADVVSVYTDYQADAKNSAF